MPRPKHKPAVHKPTPLGLRLRQLRQGMGWTQRVLAREAGVSQVLVGQLETGVRGTAPTLATVRALAGALGVTVDELAEVPSV